MLIRVSHECTYGGLEFERTVSQHRIDNLDQEMFSSYRQICDSR